MKAHALVGTTAALALGVLGNAYAEQPPPPCHPNPTAAADRLTVANRGDIVKLPDPLKARLVQLADRPHTYLPLQAFAEADKPSQLFQYYLLDSGGFEPNVFTTIFPGINDTVQLTATGGDCGLPTLGACAWFSNPSPGCPPIPDPKAFIDVFTDISPLFVINNESGWYEGWMIHDLVVPAPAPPRSDGHAQFWHHHGRGCPSTSAMGQHKNVAGVLDYGRKRRTLSQQVGPFSGSADQRRVDFREHGSVQRGTAKRRPLVLGIQLPGDQLDTPPV